MANTQSKRYANSVRSRNEYNRYYGSFAGLDASSDALSVSGQRLPYCVNMWKDYRSELGTALSTVPGYRLLARLGSGKVNGIFGAKFGGVEYIVAHVGSSLYAFKKSDRDLLSDSSLIAHVSDSLADAHSVALMYGKSLYILDSESFWKLTLKDGSFSLINLSDEASVPVITFNGEEYMQRNVLTSRYIERFESTATLKEKLEYRNVYRIYDTANHYVEVTDVGVHGETVYVPGKVTIDGIEYTVKRVAYWGLSGIKAKKLILAPEIEEIVGDPSSVGTIQSFFLETIVMPGVKTMGDGAFGGCPFLKNVWISAALTSMTSSAFHSVTSAALSNYGTIYFCGTADEYSALPVDWPKAAIYYNCKYSEIAAGDSYDTELEYSTYTSVYQFPEYCTASAAAMVASTWTVQGVERGSLSVLKFTDGNANNRYVAITVHEDGYAIGRDEEGPWVYSISLADGCQSVDRCLADGVDITSSCTPVYNNESGYVTSVTLSLEKYFAGTIDVYCTASSSYLDSLDRYKDFRRYTEYDGSMLDAICKSTVITAYDGRVFLTGNPELPNTVFYCERNADGAIDPSYYGTLSYVSTGSSTERNRAMISTPSYLAVIKEGRGALYVLSPYETETHVISKTYTVTEGVAGIGCVADGISFLDDNVFLSERGLEAISAKNVQLERNVIHRSYLVDKLLLAEGDKLESARLAVWDGYLVIAVGEHMYLADSRQLSGAGYEWFYLDGIGSYTDDMTSYRLCSVYPNNGIDYIGNGYLLSTDEEMVNPMGVYSEEVGNTVAYYILKDGKKYLVDADGERTGGEFQPLCELYSDGKLLMFGTVEGALCCFNNDKRGLSVDGEPVSGGEIHRSFYQRCDHRYISGFATKSDTCDYPHLTKDTVKNSLAIRMQATPALSVTLKVRTDREPWEIVETIKGGDLSFYGIDFGAATHRACEDMTVIGHESKRRWIEKQYYVYSDGYCKPMAIYSMAYRWNISGKIRERDV